MFILIYIILVGLVAGWATGKIMKGSGYGVLTDILLGITGGIVGAFILRVLGFYSSGGLISSILVAMFGAAGGPLGTARAQYHLRQMMIFLDGRPVNKPEVMIGMAQTKFVDGKFTDEAGAKPAALVLGACGQLEPGDQLIEPPDGGFGPKQLYKLRSSGIFEMQRAR